MEQSIEERLLAKMEGRARWCRVDHAILVAHDLPRGRIYEGFGKDSVRLMERVASKVNVLQALNELWVVTYQSGTVEIRRICGYEPRRRQ